MSMHIARWIRGYHRIGDAVAVEYPLPEAWDLRSLQLLFGLPEDNLLVDSFPIGVQEAAALSAGMDEKIDVDVYEFFLEAEAEG